MDKFAVFILTHGRPDNQITYRALRKHGYKGDIYFITDDRDETINEYKEKYKNVVIFDKELSRTNTDDMTNDDDLRAVVYARNESFRIAKRMGIKYFLQLDDDYNVFSYTHNGKLEFQQKGIKNLDRIFEIFIDFLKNNTNVSTIAFIQRGDLIGGEQNGYFNKGYYPFLKRKAMNSFFL